RRRRQPDEIKARPAQQRNFVGGRIGMQSLCLQLGQDEAIDGRAHPSRVVHRRRSLRLDLLGTPELSLPLREGLPREEGGGGRYSNQDGSAHGTPLEDDKPYLTIRIR